jgi:hypothetical protein
LFSSTKLALDGLLKRTSTYPDAIYRKGILKEVGFFTNEADEIDWFLFVAS